MYSLVRFLIVLYFCDTIKAAENGYVWIVTDIQCDDSSSVISTCSNLLDYKIPDFSNHPNPPDFSSLTDQIPLAAYYFRELGGEQCATTGTKYLCEVAYPFRCEDTNIHVDWEKVVTTCEKARNDCSNLSATIRDTMLNCSIFTSSIDPDVDYKLPRNRQVICADFPVIKNNPYSCETNYQVK